MQIINDPQLDFSDVLLRPKRSELTSRKDVNLVREFKGRWNKDLTFSAIPVMLSNMDSITSTSMVRKMLENYCMVAHNKFVTYKEWEELLKEDLFKTSLKECRLAYTIGIRKDVNGNHIELEQFRKLKNNYSDIFMHLIIDVPNGYSETFADFIAMVRKEFPDLFITCGNVVTGDMCQELLLRGADCIKCGIGSGGVCKTRLKAGVGRPQLSTMIETSDVAHGNNGYVISDGGITCAGDVCKSFGSGSDIVVIGSMFAGHDECDGEVISKYELSHYKPQMIEYDGFKIPIDHSSPVDFEGVYKKKFFKQFWGMSSTKAMEKHYGKMENYRSSEGREVLVPCKGPIQNTINDILGGLRSCATYIGAKNIKDIPKCCTFYIVNNQVSNPFNDKN